MSSFTPSHAQLRKAFDLLLTTYGEQGWWPGETPFEVMLGAILTQNTAWSNVEKAIANLKQANLLSPGSILEVSQERLADLIRPSGYFNIKASRLKNFCSFLLLSGGEAGLREQSTEELRQALLTVNGVGPETADDILLYAFERPVFVIDAYTRRIFTRLGVANGMESYEELRSGFESALGPEVALYNEFHALIVRHAKLACNTKPHCEQCGLVEICSMGSKRQISSGG
ncbi:MAG: endonuclease III domain-containing protein [Gammaproteobacteria bacterium]